MKNKCGLPTNETEEVYEEQTEPAIGYASASDYSEEPMDERLIEANAALLWCIALFIFALAFCAVVLTINHVA